MYKVLCITNRQLCNGDFFEQIERLSKARPAGIILREKDLTEAAYEQLAIQVMEICGRYQVPCILHQFVDVAKKLQAKAIHVPMPVLMQMTEEERKQFPCMGASCHSLEEAVEAVRLGCTYITASHIFATDCKKGLAPKGIPFLKEICDQVSIPVYALGGITPGNSKEIRTTAAAGVCIMSGCMTTVESDVYIRSF